MINTNYGLVGNILGSSNEYEEVGVEGDEGRGLVLAELAAW